mgnify:CR=1 FL=1
MPRASSRLISTANRCGLVEARWSDAKGSSSRRSPQLIAVASLKRKAGEEQMYLDNEISTANRCGLVEARRRGCRSPG